MGPGAAVWGTSRCSIITCLKGKGFELEGRSACCEPASRRVSEMSLMPLDCWVFSWAVPCQVFI